MSLIWAVPGTHALSSGSTASSSSLWRMGSNENIFYWRVTGLWSEIVIGNIVISSILCSSALAVKSNLCVRCMLVWIKCQIALILGIWIAIHSLIHLLQIDLKHFTHFRYRALTVWLSIWIRHYANKIFPQPHNQETGAVLPFTNINPPSLFYALRFQSSYFACGLIWKRLFSYQNNTRLC